MSKNLLYDMQQELLNFTESSKVLFCALLSTYNTVENTHNTKKRYFKTR